jgi:hypothetical protein
MDRTFVPLPKWKKHALSKMRIGHSAPGSASGQKRHAIQNVLQP